MEYPNRVVFIVIAMKHQIPRCLTMLYHLIRAKTAVALCPHFTYPLYLYNEALLRISYESKAIPVTDRGRPQGCETSRLPRFLDKRQRNGGGVVSPTHRQRFTPQKHYLYASGTHFC
jgi:hypothetical protein